MSFACSRYFYISAFCVLDVPGDANTFLTHFNTIDDAGTNTGVGLRRGRDVTFLIYILRSLIEEEKHHCVREQGMEGSEDEACAARTFDVPLGLHYCLMDSWVIAESRTHSFT